MKNSIPYSHFLIFQRLCSDGSDYYTKSAEIRQFFKARGYLEYIDRFHLTSQQCRNNETVAMLVHQTNPVGVKGAVSWQISRFLAKIH